MIHREINIEENLNRIAKLDAPPFLFTRIEARIASEYAPSSRSFAGLSLAYSCIIIALNIWLVSDAESVDLKVENNNAISIVSNSVGLEESNQLYYD